MMNNNNGGGGDVGMCTLEFILLTTIILHGWELKRNLNVRDVLE